MVGTAVGLVFLGFQFHVLDVAHSYQPGPGGYAGLALISAAATVMLLYAAVVAGDLLSGWRWRMAVAAGLSAMLGAALPGYAAFSAAAGSAELTAETAVEIGRVSLIITVSSGFLAALAVLLEVAEELLWVRRLELQAPG